LVFSSDRINHPDLGEETNRCDFTLMHNYKWNSKTIAGVSSSTNILAILLVLRTAIGMAIRFG
jgi:hypothetical protein